MKQGAECLTDISNGKMNAPRTNRLSQRMEIAVLHRSNITSPRIAWFSDCHLRTVGRWLVRIASGEPITDHPRSGRPRLYTEQTWLKTIAFFCQTPPLPGCTRWTLKGCRRIPQAPSGGDWMWHESCSYCPYSYNACFTSSSEEIFLANHRPGVFSENGTYHRSVP